MSELLAVEEALALVLERARPLPSAPVPLDEAVGRVLAEDALAVVDLPRFPSSAMDGFALRSADTPATLRVVDRIAAGAPSSRSLARGEAMGIATGGVVPEDADAVVPIEQVDDEGERVVVPSAVPVGANVRPRGGDIRAGERVLSAGTLLSPSRLAALAAAGVASPVCARRPRVSIVTTGTELRRPGETLAEGEIYESNGVMLAALLAQAGAVVEPHERVVDDEESHRAALARGLEADVLVTSGGVSMGPHDLVRSTIASLGGEEVFWGVAMRPGKPLSFSVRGETLVFGLPGNPVSSYVGAVLFVLPALRALQGLREPEPRYAAGVLGAPVARRPRRDDYQRARLELQDGVAVLHPIAGQESHMIVRAAAADALVHIPRGEGELVAGATVRYLPLDRLTGA
ncbi:MAG TPA: gephyrin-like molybdotransferase Glp [Gaiella sp.]|nr:gephyrin-like molybdotransferase Glp [Gaiella sp.]